MFETERVYRIGIVIINDKILLDFTVVSINIFWY